MHVYCVWYIFTVTIAYKSQLHAIQFRRNALYFTYFTVAMWFPHPHPHPHIHILYMHAYTYRHTHTKTPVTSFSIVETLKRCFKHGRLRISALLLFHRARSSKPAYKLRRPFHSPPQFSLLLFEIMGSVRWLWFGFCLQISEGVYLAIWEVRRSGEVLCANL